MWRKAGEDKEGGQHIQREGQRGLDVRGGSRQSKGGLQIGKRMEDKKKGRGWGEKARDWSQRK